jgi:hypothetical protein
MPDIDDQMKIAAEYAQKTAREMYGFMLDYSEDSLSALDIILEKVYGSFSEHTGEEGEGGLDYNTAIIWGSYLGEYMRRKWGGQWIQKGNEKHVVIENTEFSPILFIYQKITDHPDYRVWNYMQETNTAIYTAAVHNKKSQYVSETAGLPKEISAGKKKSKIFNIDIEVIYASVGIFGILVIVTACIVGYVAMSEGGRYAIGIFTDATATRTITPPQVIMASATQRFTVTPFMTITPLPTYTPRPTWTARPTSTPYLTATLSPTPMPTATPSLTPTKTAIPYEPPIPTDTRRPPVHRPPSPTNTSTRVPPTSTSIPRPTGTQPPPDKILSCSVNPSSVSIGDSKPLVFTVQFSAPGYGINSISFDKDLPGQQGCTDGNTDGNNTASCQGNSGTTSTETEVKATIATGLGNCTVIYQFTNPSP